MELFLSVLVILMLAAFFAVVRRQSRQRNRHGIDNTPAIWGYPPLTPPNPSHAHRETMQRKIRH